MRIDIKHPAFKAQRLSAKTASFLEGPKLYLKGALQRKSGGAYPVTADSGQVLRIPVMKGRCSG